MAKTLKDVKEKGLKDKAKKQEKESRKAKDKEWKASKRTSGAHEKDEGSKTKKAKSEAKSEVKSVPKCEAKKALPEKADPGKTPVIKDKVKEKSVPKTKSKDKSKDKERKETKETKETPTEPKVKENKKKLENNETEGKEVKDTKGTVTDPPSRRVSFKATPTEVVSTHSPSSSAVPATPILRKAPASSDDGFTSPPVSLASLKALKEEANSKGLSLEQYMEEISEKELEKNLEAQMKEMMAEHEASTKTKTKPEDEAESSESEGDSSDEEDEAPVTEALKKIPDGDSDKDEDEDEDQSSDSSGDDSGDDGKTDSEEASDDDEEEDDEMAEAVDALVTADPKPKEVEKVKEPEKEEEPKKNKTDLPKKETEEALAKAAQSQLATTEANADFSRANSKTHKAEWDRFNRQCADRKRFPVSLAQHFVRDKADLFRQWLMCGGSWDKVEVTFRRRAEKVTTNRRQREGVKARELYQRYSREKADQLMASLKSRGLWYYDPDFEGDEEEVFFYANSGNKIRSDDVAAESTSATIRDVGNEELGEALLASDGVLGAGFQPNMQAATEEGQKNLIEALSGEATAAAKPKKANKRKAKGDGSATEKAEPQTLEELTTAKMEECLKHGADGRKYSIMLQNLEYSGDLSNQLMRFSTKMEQVFKHLQDLKSRKVVEAKPFQKHFSIVDEKLEWFTKAEAAAKALLSGCGLGGKKAKSKKSKKASKEKDEDPKEPAAICDKSDKS